MCNPLPFAVSVSIFISSQAHINMEKEKLEKKMQITEAQKPRREGSVLFVSVLPAKSSHAKVLQ